MAKLFTIIEGLENLGAIKTGGQGSVYKARRLGEIITAVKLLPTPIEAEDPNNKHYIDFQNEVEKLKKVNEQPNPNVVSIVGAGLTDTGGFPFIEMEFVDGPDLGELLKPPHEKLFTIKEAIRVGEHLANALAHCHKFNVRHGDIKSNNIKFNLRTGNYVLLDFGLAVMSDEERRTSLRHAGAIEFMAPEQNEGQMLFQTDVYSFGIIMYELLAGEVPFPLHDSGETARNRVRLAHMEAPVPDLLSSRKKNIPGNWPGEKKERETQLPVWLCDMIKKCLEKKPADRFSNGMELQEFILLNTAFENKRDELNAAGAAVWQEENQKLLSQKDFLQQQVKEHQDDLSKKDKEILELKQRLKQREEIAGIHHGSSNKKIVSRPLFYGMLALTLLLASIAAYGLFFRTSSPTFSQSSMLMPDSQLHSSDSARNISEAENAAKKPLRKKLTPSQRRDSMLKVAQSVAGAADTPDDTSAAASRDTTAVRDEVTRYKVKSTAYFYNQPDETTRRNAFIVHWNNAVLTPTDEKNGFVYVVFTNDLGQTSKGWLRKQDLIAVK